MLGQAYRNKNKNYLKTSVRLKQPQDVSVLWALYIIRVCLWTDTTTEWWQQASLSFIIHAVCAISVSVLFVCIHFSNKSSFLSHAMMNGIHIWDFAHESAVAFFLNITALRQPIWLKRPKHIKTFLKMLGFHNKKVVCLSTLVTLFIFTIKL